MAISLLPGRGSHRFLPRPLDFCGLDPSGGEVCHELRIGGEKIILPNSLGKTQAIFSKECGVSSASRVAAA